MLEKWGGAASSAAEGTDSAVANDAALVNRSSGRLAIARRMAESSEDGTSARFVARGAAATAPPLVNRSSGRLPIARRRAEPSEDGTSARFVASDAGGSSSIR